MARIPEHELQRLKDDISVQRLVEASGVELKRCGKDWLGRCPFHDDRDASLVVSPAKNLWHCFGCGIGGGPIDWVMKSRGVSFRHAVELLKDDPSLAAGAAPAKRTTVRSLPAPVALDADDQALLAQTLDYYHQRLKETAEAQAYLAARGLDHPALVDTFKLGVADRTLGLRLPQKNRQAGAAIRERLQKIGLLRDSGHEHFNGSLVVPVFDAAGQVVEVYGRKLRDDLRPGTPKHLYLPGPHAGVFNLAGVIEAGLRAPGQRDVILCEALIDALTFWCAGFTNVTSSFGAEGFTADLLQAFKVQGIERVLIAYDRDDAGERAAEKLAPELIGEGFEVLRVVFPKGMDANEYARKVTPAAKSLALVVRQAQWVGGVRPVPAAEDKTPEPQLPTEDAPALPSSAAELPAPRADEKAEEAVPAELPDELQLDTGALAWRVRGWKKNTSAEVMKVNVQARRKPEPGAAADSTLGAYFVDTLDLYAARSRAAFLRAASVELGLSEDAMKRELGAVLLKLEALQDALLTQARERVSAAKAPVLSADEEAQALELLQSPNLIERIVTDLHALGVVGEDLNLLAAYLAAVSRKLDTPLAVLIQSSSAAGKSSLMDAVLQLVPEEERIRYSAMTGQSLFYLGETNLQHKILAIAEEEGVRQAAYALKLLQSDGELTIASTAKDEATGNLSTRQYTVKGPVMLMLTTTAIDVDEELLNRCLVLTVNESPEQTRAIHARQRHRQTLEGMLQADEREAIGALHHNAQRLLSAVRVVNPYANELSFAANKTRARRDHMKYLTLIRAIALLHQHQREVKTVERRGKLISYIEVTKQDIALANAIAHEVLGRTLDELPPQTRRLLTLVREWVQAECTERNVPQSQWRFTRAQLRAATRWGDTQLKVHLARLVDFEHLALHRRGLAHEYELIYDAKHDDGGEDARAHFSGLVDVDALAHDYDGDRSGLQGLRSGSGRPLVGGWSGLGRGGVDAVQSEPPCGLPADARAQKLNGAKTPISAETAPRPVVPTAAH
ncbi:CHC2 zinc finger domain-containing protein [Methylibium rhizosphaerae]|uniref:CHC2 zinc finger domain-containing protein n=1 Tax=Methylibium rhizosphaerae TaxID=2570323 RepID=UPI00112673F7|nr:CHC2 zinc finger domain-containing protein [Methylibium rhizosphaerae]